MFRALLLCVFCLYVASSDAGATSLDDLLSLASDDALPEVRQAAGFALSIVLINAGWTQDQLRALALEGESAEVRSAAARALGALRVGGAQGADLIDLLQTAEFIEERQVIAQALAMEWLGANLPLETLTQWALSAEPAEARAAVAPALAQALSDSALSAARLLDGATSGTTAEFQQAAARGLILRLQGSSLYALTPDELFELGSGQSLTLTGSITGLNPQLRAAAAVALQRRWQSDPPSVQSLQRIAGDPSASLELRTAAGAVLSERLLSANLSLEQLEAMAAGATEQLRAATVDALVQALVGAVGRLELSAAQLIESVAGAQSVESGVARAQAAFVLLRTALATVEGQVALEAIVNGEATVVSGFSIDGSLEAFRRGAVDFLTGIYTFFGFIDRFEDPLQQLMDLAANDSLTREFRAAAAGALVEVFRADRGRALQALSQFEALLQALLQRLATLDIASAFASLGQLRATLESERSNLITTAEVAGDFTVAQQLNESFNRALATIESALRGGRLTTARSEITGLQRQLQGIESSIQGAPEVTIEFLEQVALTGQTPELRQAASAALSERLSGAGFTVEALIELAGRAGSLQLQQAAVAALAFALVASADELYRQAIEGGTSALRAAAAEALLGALQGDLGDEAIQSLADARAISVGALLLDGAQMPLQRAAAQALLDHFADPALFSLDALFEQATSAPTQALQESAAQALAKRLIASSASQADLFELISERTLLFGQRPGTSAALSGALAQALADRLCRDALSTQT